jgi:hypothetical protein
MKRPPMKAASSPRTACDHPGAREEASLTAFCICAAYDRFAGATLNIAQLGTTESRYVRSDSGCGKRITLTSACLHGSFLVR